MFDLQLNGVVPHDNLVLIKMRPDEHGRFGFNVKVREQPAAKTDTFEQTAGIHPSIIHPSMAVTMCRLTACICLFLFLQGGADQKMPIIVSRVAPGTSVSLQLQCLLRWTQNSELASPSPLHSPPPAG